MYEDEVQFLVRYAGADIERQFSLPVFQHPGDAGDELAAAHFVQGILSKAPAPFLGLGGRDLPVQDLAEEPFEFFVTAHAAVHGMVHDEAVADLLAVGLGQTGKGARLDGHTVEDHAVTVENKTFQGHADSLFAPSGTAPYRKDTGTGPRPAAKADEDSRAGAGSRPRPPAGQDPYQTRGDPRHPRPGPQPRRALAVVTVADGACRDTAHDGEGGHVTGDHGTRAHHGAPADVHVGRDDAVGPDPDIVPDDDLARMVALLQDGHIMPGKAVVGGPQHCAGAHGHMPAHDDAPAVGRHMGIGRDGHAVAQDQFSVPGRDDAAPLQPS